MDNFIAKKSVSPPLKERKFGTMKGIADDFDEPLDDFKTICKAKLKL